MKKLVSVLLTLCLLLSLVTVVAAEPPAGAEGWEPFAERVKITVPVYDRSKAGYPAVDEN